MYPGFVVPQKKWFYTQSTLLKRGRRGTLDQKSLFPFLACFEGSLCLLCTWTGEALDGGVRGTKERKPKWSVNGGTKTQMFQNIRFSRNKEQKPSFSGFEEQGTKTKIPNQQGTKTKMAKEQRNENPIQSLYNIASSRNYL